MPAPIYLPQSNWGQDFASGISSALNPILQLLSYKRLAEAPGKEAALRAQEQSAIDPEDYYNLPGLELPAYQNPALSGPPPVPWESGGAGQAIGQAPGQNMFMQQPGQTSGLDLATAGLGTGAPTPPVPPERVAIPHWMREKLSGPAAINLREHKRPYSEEEGQPDWLKKMNYALKVAKNFGKPLTWQHATKIIGMDTKADEVQGMVEYLTGSNIPVTPEAIQTLAGSYIDPGYQLITDDAGNLKLVATGGTEPGKVKPVRGAKGKATQPQKQTIDDMVVPIVKKVLKGEKLTPQEKELYDAKVLKTGMWEQLLQAAGIGLLGGGPGGNIPKTAEDYEKTLQY